MATAQNRQRRRAYAPGPPRWSPAPARAAGEEVPARDRILDAASALFYRDGIHTVGVDRIIADAQVAKATFYRHFPCKDDLVVAWLERSESRWFDVAIAYADSTTAAPLDRVRAFFEWICMWQSDPSYRGCAYANTAVELGDSNERARAVIIDAQLCVQRWFEAALTEAGCSAPDVVAFELFVVVPGALITSVARGGADASVAARGAIDTLLRAAVPG